MFAQRPKYSPNTPVSRSNDPNIRRQETRAPLSTAKSPACVIGVHRSAARSPDLHRIISPAALVRAIDVHFGQSSEQMRARVSTAGSIVSRTGTFSSRAGLLRAIAEIANHELSKPHSALLARSEDELERIASGYQGGRVDALCNHGRAIGVGVRTSASGIVEMRTNTSQYSIQWERAIGARISHLHPWVSPY